MIVFVGPNGSGKSLILREIEEYCTRGSSVSFRMLSGLEITYPDAAEIGEFLARRVDTRPEVLRTHPEGFIQVLIPNVTTKDPSAQFHPGAIPREHFLSELAAGRKFQVENPGVDVPNPWNGILQCYVSALTLALDGRGRLALTERRPAGDLLGPPTTHLAALFKDDTARETVRQIVFDAFGQHFVIDPTELGFLRIRLSDRAPTDSDEEQALSARARAFHQAAMDIAQGSDGLKAFTGLICGLSSSDYRVMLIDEPEAFLHPPLARKLGEHMASLASERKGSSFAATHSSDFLSGCIESGKPVGIVRLTYESAIPAARTLLADELTPLMRDPLLRSTDVLSALFHRAAVVTEADADRAFYQEINHRLIASGERGVRDAVFLNAQNKQTERRIIGPLRRLGIPAAAVVDFDMLKKKDLTDLMKECCVPDPIAHGLAVTRGDIERHFSALGLNMRDGMGAINDTDNRNACSDLPAQLETYGIFVVANGALESWLPALGVPGPKQEWLPKVFEKMGSDPSTQEYLRPARGDVWDFVRQVGAWTANPERKGMP